MSYFKTELFTFLLKMKIQTSLYIDLKDFCYTRKLKQINTLNMPLSLGFFTTRTLGLSTTRDSLFFTNLSIKVHLITLKFIQQNSPVNLNVSTTHHAYQFLASVENFFR